MKWPLLAIQVTTVSLLTSPLAHSATEIWSVDGFKNPQSALYDSERDIVYVSNVDGNVTEKNGAGHISRMTKDGKLQEAEWVTGLNAPNGLVQHDNLLYVSDIDQLVSIDVDTGKIVRAWDAEGAQFLNDLAVDSSGRICVSDMVTDSIYRLDGDTLN